MGDDVQLSGTSVCEGRVIGTVRVAKTLEEAHLTQVNKFDRQNVTSAGRHSDHEVYGHRLVAFIPDHQRIGH